MANKISVIIDVAAEKGVAALKNFRTSISDADGAVGKFKAGAAGLSSVLKENMGAAAIAAGTADAGLGIYSAVKSYRLGFVPLWQERYDFLVLEDAMQLESMQQFREILTGNALKIRLQELGGYTIENPGEIIQWN